MASAYPGSLDTFTTKQNKQDDYNAEHINDLQNAVVATETELGTDVAGTATDLKTRLARCVADNGAMKNGTSFPASPNDGDFFYRTDENVMYIYNGSSWDSQGQSLSNVIFTWSGCDEISTDSYGLLQGTSLNPSGVTGATYSFYGNETTTYQTILRFRFTKIAGVSTITIFARIWSDSGGALSTPFVKVDIGGKNNEVSGDNSTPTWVTSSSIDLTSATSLVDGTTYDGIVQLKSENSDTSEGAFCSAVTLIAS